MVYTALLRGINVGGKSKVDMSRLKLLFENLGCNNVLTYINSGNVIFRDDRSVEALVPILEKEIAEEFNLDIKILLRDVDSILAICRKVPEHWTNDDNQRTDVMFLWDDIDNEEILNRIVVNSEIENVMYVNGALIWNIGRENVTKGNGIKLIKSNIYKSMTVRNINTVRKINELMQTV